MKLRKLFSAAALLISLITVARAQELQVKKTVEEYFRKSAGLGFSGAVLVADDERILTRSGYGWADVRRRIPVKPDTIFDIGSAVKSFTATAVMQLEEQGKLTTADKLSKYFKDVPAEKADITIHQLLTHTAGLNFDYFYDVAKPEEAAIMRDREKYLKSVLGFPLAFRPGEGRAYSNTGFTLLAMIVEEVSGETYEKYVAEHLFKPAGMTETGYYIPRDKRRVARGYNDGDTDFGYPWETQWENRVPLWDLKGNGGMLSTLDDMYKWMRAVVTGKIVSPKTRDKMFALYHAPGNQAYGWFFSKSEAGDKSYVWTAGDAVPAGWNVELRWYREDDLTTIVLTNRRIRAGSLRRPASLHLMEIAIFNKPPSMPEFVDVSVKKLRRWEGIYRFDSGALFYVKATEAATGSAKSAAVLTISGAGQQAIDLLFSANSTAGLTKLSLDLNAKTNAFLEALRKNDPSALKAILPPDSAVEDALKRWNDFVRQNGELETIEVLGTSPLNQTGLQTFVKLKFKNLSGVYKVTWRDQKLWEQSDDSMQPAITAFVRKSFVEFPLNLHFLPRSENEFATYDLVKGRTVGVQFRADGSLAVKTKDGDIVAHRVSTK
jgi:CubicO group peptidase (beta-lactamase class C family)